MQQYLPLKQKSAELGDQYYRCLNDTLTRPHTRKAIEECLDLGRRYRAALRKQLRDLKRLPDGPFVRREAELISEYLKLIERDLESFGRGQTEKIPRKRPKRDH